MSFHRFTTTKTTEITPGVPSFENEIINSSKQILAEDADAVIIRQFASPDQCKELASHTSGREAGVFADANPEILYEAFSVLHDIDALVEKWANNEDMYGYTALSGITYAVRRAGGIRPHVDGATIEQDDTHRLFGPLTASLRVDSNPQTVRTVTVNSWPSSDPCLQDGKPTDKYIRFEPNRRRLFVEKFKLWPSSRSFVQNPGDLFLMRGHPRPVRHAIAQTGTTEQIIFGYQMKGAGNAEKDLAKLRRAEYDRLPTTRWGVCDWPT